MKTKIELDIEDVKQIIADTYNVDIDKISMRCGEDKGDGRYPGRGSYCDVTIELKQKQMKKLQQEKEFHLYPPNTK